MKLYYAVIQDHKGNDVISLPLTTSSKHSAHNAKEYLKDCPPAAGFSIRIYYPSAGHICAMLNNEPAQQSSLIKKIQLINAIKELLN